MRRTVIIGDIHGCFDELVGLLEKVELAEDDLLVSVGDLVDRGPKPLDVVNLFRGRPNSVAVMGNHERKHVRGIYSYAQEITRLQAGDGYADMVEWMRTLPYYFENDHVRVVHAGLVPGIPLADQREEILCGSTRGERELQTLFPDSFWHDHYTDAKPIVFGHHVTGPEPLIRDNRILGLDTGACHGGVLTALSLPDFMIHSVPARADHWSQVRDQWQLPVLKTKPWHDYTWPELAREITRFSPTSDAPTTAWLTAVEQWSTDLRSMLPALVTAAHTTATRLDTDRLQQHPAAPYLFQARRNRLDLSSLTEQCTTPRKTIALATALQLNVPEFPR
ncbi:serine/threonine protein phosphatase [Nocardia sp. ET3-3]|uniref:Serine/threonine protein phosphatase n=1 Tax=Nocardia terrae TaxID=2675851 RepID=A0A7K1V6W8_9NOCA|nr:serine/threonine protein phosphatase [Nocardia terrae]